jgi:hypothetical protein
VNRRGVAARNVTMRKQYCGDFGRAALLVFCSIRRPSSMPTLTFISALGGRGVFRIERAGRVATLDLSAWQRATGSDLRSRIANPLLDASQGYKPRKGSPAIGRGRISTPGAQSG